MTDLQETSVETKLNSSLRIIEETLKTFGTQLSNIEKISSENTRRIVELEKNCYQMRQNTNTLKDQVRLFFLIYQLIYKIFKLIFFKEK